jgi:hypothetical protein
VHKGNLLKYLSGTFLLFVMASADAALIDRSGGFIYDDVLDITWAQDANINGWDTWDNQIAWAASLSLYDSVRDVTWDDWRLPTALNGDGSDPCSGAGCTGSEMSHLYNVDGITPLSMSPFTNVQSSYYWSGTVYVPNPNVAWHFNFIEGEQLANAKTSGFYAFAVRDGDVAAIPVPATVWLLGSALGGLGWLRGRRTV